MVSTAPSNITVTIYRNWHESALCSDRFKEIPLPKLTTLFNTLALALTGKKSIISRTINRPQTTILALLFSLITRISAATQQKHTNKSTQTKAHNKQSNRSLEIPTMTYLYIFKFTKLTYYP
jgi:hypothetical protein